MRDVFWMEKALLLAKEAEQKGEVPVGALMVFDDKLIGEGYNCPISTHDPSAHAEMIALRAAAKNMNNYRLVETSLYVTLEPCMMCLGAMIHARVSRIVFGAYDPKEGMVRKISHRIDYTGGILEEQCSVLLKNFFQTKRHLGEKNGT